MVPRGFNLTTLNLYWLKRGKPSQYQLEKSSGTAFAKTHLLPLSPPNMIKIIQACVASIKTYSKGINQIAEYTLAPNKLLTTKTNDHMVILREKVSTRKPSRNIILRAVVYDIVRYKTVLPLQDTKR